MRHLSKHCGIKMIQHTALPNLSPKIVSEHQERYCNNTMIAYVACYLLYKVSITYRLQCLPPLGVISSSIDKVPSTMMINLRNLGENQRTNVPVQVMNCATSPSFWCHEKTPVDMRGLQEKDDI